MSEHDADALKNQLNIARNEINKLRQQIKNLQHIQRKDVEKITCALSEFRCEGCKSTAAENKYNSNDLAGTTTPAKKPTQTKEYADADDNIQHTNTGSDIKFHSIGIIRTAFPEKRAVPRQASVGGRLRGVIELNSDIFTNPEHSLEGLNEFSHLWIIYHFHKNNAHPKAKVSPPRLAGERVGVFSTRSPHRPCPIGLSLVEIDKIEGASIAFFGTDMVDNTPVLDIKPFIPFYDTPLSVESGRISAGPSDTVDFYNTRQEPDGEESELEMLGASMIPNAASGCSQTNFANHKTPPSAVKIPNWIVANNRLLVCFNERAETQLKELQVQRQCIIDILEADPRSVYLRTKYGSQIFTFQLSEVTVTCKFDDKAGTVTVVQIRRTENVQDDDGLPEHHS